MGPIDFLWEWKGVGGHTCIHCMLHCILGTLMYTGQPVLVPNLLLDTVHMRLVWIPGMDQVSTSLHFNIVKFRALETDLKQDGKAVMLYANNC